MKPARKGWVPEKLWDQIKASSPIPCVDVIISDRRGAVMLGWRVIRPYINVWALPGGRIRLREDLRRAVRRILAAHNVKAEGLYLVGVFPISFPSRQDISICVAAKCWYGHEVPDGTEFKKVRWFRNLPPQTGGNYRKMIKIWRAMRAMPELVAFNRL